MGILCQIAKQVMFMFQFLTTTCLETTKNMQTNLQVAMVFSPSHHHKTTHLKHPLKEGQGKTLVVSHCDPNGGGACLGGIGFRPLMKQARLCCVHVGRILYVC